jgi:hypothetical protein
MKACRESRCIAPLILGLGLDGGEWSASRPCHFTPGKKLLLPIEWEKKIENPSGLVGNQTSDSPVNSLIATD